MENSAILSAPNVLAHERALLDAMSNHDTDKLNELIHDGLVYVHPTGQVLTKKMYLQSYKAKHFAIERLSSTDFYYNIVDDVATVSVYVKMSWSMVRDEVKGRFRYMRTWKKFGNCLKVVSSSCVEVRDL
ncbi:nuclear transport factor 2 family protein [Pedobacter namyangjuensis]|mgnify:CR=1 FL=1|uniref:nuclear transport factor 2 family protein n=1 Tax=Pedobacter namyangjuensis TaxID=600626 RepID=UPI000DE41301|nr:nuclear transport factor 2 family protein [Pedobacter namyangjuensis]